MLARGATRSCCSARVVGTLLPKRRIGGGIRSSSSTSSSSTSSSTSNSPSPTSSLSSSSPSEQPSWLRKDLAIVLVHTQIPQNAGSAARTAAATRVPLHLVGPLPFEVSDKRVRRAGLDYWNSVVLRVWDDWRAFERGVVSDLSPRLVAFSKRGNVHYATPGVYGAPSPQKPTFLLFGAETTGLPPEAHKASAAVVRLPIDQREVRSLNLAVTVGVGVYEALRQLDGTDSLPEIGE